MRSFNMAVLVLATAFSMSASAAGFQMRVQKPGLKPEPVEVEEPAGPSPYQVETSAFDIKFTTNGKQNTRHARFTLQVDPVERVAVIEMEYAALCRDDRNCNKANQVGSEYMVVNFQGTTVTHRVLLPTGVTKRGTFSEVVSDNGSSAREIYLQLSRAAVKFLLTEDWQFQSVQASVIGDADGKFGAIEVGTWTDVTSETVMTPL